MSTKPPGKPFGPSRSNPGAFKKGVSGNPGGKPKALVEMARMVREKTRDGAELVEFALGVLRNEDEKQTDKGRQWACEWLADRGFGKPQQAIDVTSGDQPLHHAIDVSQLTKEQLEALAAIPQPDAEGDDDPDPNAADSH